MLSPVLERGDESEKTLHLSVVYSFFLRGPYSGYTDFSYKMEVSYKHQIAEIKSFWLGKYFFIFRILLGEIIFKRTLKFKSVKYKFSEFFLQNLRMGGKIRIKVCILCRNYREIRTIVLKKNFKSPCSGTDKLKGYNCVTTDFIFFNFISRVFRSGRCDSEEKESAGFIAPGRFADKTWSLL